MIDLNYLEFPLQLLFTFKVKRAPSLDSLSFLFWTYTPIS